MTIKDDKGNDTQTMEIKPETRETFMKEINDACAKEIEIKYEPVKLSVLDAVKLTAEDLLVLEPFIDMEEPDLGMIPRQKIRATM